MARRPVLFGTALVSAANVLKLLLQFGVLPVLAHLLTPSAYGLIALAMPFVLFVNIFADAGISNAIIREQNPSPDLESTVFWVSTCVSGGLSLFVALLAWPFAMIVRQPEIMPILLTLAPMLLLGGMISVANAKILKDQRLEVFAASDVISAAGAAAVAIWTASHGWGAWSLVAQQLTMATIRFVWMMSASGVRIRLVCRPVLLAKFWNFGANVMGVGVLDFVSRNIDNLLVGAFLGIAALGHYSMAYQIMRMPELVIAGPVCMSLYPALCAVADDVVLFRRDALAYIGLVASVILPIFAGLAAVADLAIGTVLGEKWRAAEPVLVWLGPAGVAFCAYAVFGTILYAKGKAHLQLRLSLIIAWCTALGVLVGSVLGIAGVAIGVTLAMLIAAPFYLKFVGRELEASPLHVLSRFRSPALATLAMVASVLAGRAAFQSLPGPVLLVAVIMMGGVVYAGALAFLDGKEITAQMRLFIASRRARGAVTADSLDEAPPGSGREAAAHLDQA